LLIDCEEDRTLRAVLVGMLREGITDPKGKRPGAPPRRAAPPEALALGIRCRHKSRMRMIDPIREWEAWKAWVGDEQDPCTEALECRAPRCAVEGRVEPESASGVGNP
jgi:hypothetical protein